MIIFLRRPDSWRTLELTRFQISWFISEFVISGNKNSLSMFWLLIAIILGWFWVAQIFLELGAQFSSQLGQYQQRDPGNEECLTLKKSSKVSAISSFCSSIKSFSTIVILLKWELLLEKEFHIFPIWFTIGNRPNDHSDCNSLV